MKHPTVLILLLLLASYQMMGQNVTTNPISTSEYEFTPAAFPTFPKLGTESSYRYFWNFGDGGFKLIDAPHTNSPSDVTNQINHDYRAAGTYNASLEITQIYSPPANPDDDMERGIAPPVNIGTGNPTAPGNNVDMLGSSLNINPVREVRPGFPMTFIVTYDLRSCPSPISEWEFIFTYNSFILAPPTGGIAAIVEGYNGETLNTIESSFGTGIDKVVVNISPTGTGNQHSFFLNFDVSEDAEVGQPLDAIGTFGIFDPMNPPPPCDEFMLPNMHVAKSYDPNYKLVSKDTITTNPAQLLHYVVHFQNTGAGPTDSIKIVDQLDPRLDPTTLVITDVRIGFQHITPTDLAANPDPSLLPSTPYPWMTVNPTPVFQFSEEMPTATSFTWHFDDAVLRGTKEAGYGAAFTELETTGTIEFDIHTCGFMEYGVTIENEALIFFDDNPEVITEPALTHKYCCELLADTLNGIFFDINNYFDATVYPNLIAYSFTSDTAAQNRRPMVFVNSANYRCDYRPVAKGYTGLDIMTVIVCNNANPPVCDTVDIRICANVNHKANQYPCDTTTAICTTTGLSPHFLTPQETIHVYPNPTKDWVNIDARNRREAVEHLAIYDLNGRKLLDISPDSSGITQVSLSRLPAGLYLLRVNERWSKKLVKQ